MFACIVLTGWLLGSEPMERLGLAASVTMNPTTALGMLGLSAAILLRVCKRDASDKAANGILAAVLALGVLKLVDVCTGNHLGIDSIVLASRLAHGHLAASRMAPNAALCFVLIAGALLVMRRPSQRSAVLSQGMALAASVIAVFAVVGYLYGVTAFYGLPAFFPMALHTAFGFLCVAAYVLVRTGERGLLSPISDRGSAGRISRVLLPAAVVIPVLSGWLRQQGERAGLFTPEIGVALMVMASMLSLIALIWWNAGQLLAFDTRRTRAEIDLARMAHHDFLTGLANRGRFMDRLAARMTHHRRRTDEDSFAVIYMDIDGFKTVNDQLGHMAGDTLLREVALHLQRCGRNRSDLVARLGGDEFGMLLEHIRSSEEAAAVARRIVNGMPQKYGPPGRQVPIGMSVGIVIADLRHETPEGLLNDADLALYDAKRQGKGRFALYADEAERVAS